MEIKNNCAVAITLMLDEKEINFRLTLLEDTQIIGDFKLCYGFISDDGSKYFSSPYSGGTTGCGTRSVIDITKDFKNRYNIISNDIVEINKILKIKTEELYNKQKIEKQQKIEKIRRINELPETFDTVVPGLFFKRVKSSERDGRVIYARI